MRVNSCGRSGADDEGPVEAFTAGLPRPDESPPVERWVHDMPQFAPPASLVASVMESIEPDPDKPEP